MNQRKQLNILNYLRQRYPIVENQWKVILPVSLFIGLFMVIFQPFGLLTYSGANKLLILAGYGLVTFIILLFDLFLIPWIFPEYFRVKNWKVWKELLHLLFILFTIGLGNLFYSSLVFTIPFSFNAIVTIQLFTLAIGIIPIATLTILKQNYLEKRNREGAEALSSGLSSHPGTQDPGRIIRFSSDNEKEIMEIPVVNLIQIQSDGNYITVFYFKEGRVQSTLLRNTLKSVEHLIGPFPRLFKCHRSFIVNLDRITRIKGNSQGYQLVMEGCDEEVPVSRSNIPALKSALGN